MEGLVAMGPEKLAALLESEGPTSGALVLDCRSLVAFGIGRVTGSVHVRCPAILRRRAGGRPLALRYLLPSGYRTVLRAGSQVVLCSEEGNPGPRSTAAFIAECLRAETNIDHIHYLTGGFQSFSRICPQLCVFPSQSLGSPGKIPSPWGCAKILRKSQCGLACRVSPGAKEGPAEILPHLYLGSARHTDYAKTLGITALLNVSTDGPTESSSLRYKCIPVKDTPSEPIGRFFQEAFDFIEETRLGRGKVLVHCRAGVSRSATICVAYMMSALHLRMEDAFRHVLERRHVIAPNFGFLGQLLDLERSLRLASPSEYHSSSTKAKQRFDFEEATCHSDDQISTS